MLFNGCEINTVGGITSQPDLVIRHLDEHIEFFADIDEETRNYVRTVSYYLARQRKLVLALGEAYEENGYVFVDIDDTDLSFTRTLAHECTHWMTHKFVTRKRMKKLAKTFLLEIQEKGLTKENAEAYLARLDLIGHPAWEICTPITDGLSIALNVQIAHTYGHEEDYPIKFLPDELVADTLECAAYNEDGWYDLFEKEFPKTTFLMNYIWGTVLDSVTSL